MTIPLLLRRRARTHRNERTIRSARDDAARNRILTENRGRSPRWTAIGGDEHFVDVTRHTATLYSTIHADDPDLRSLPGRTLRPRQPLWSGWSRGTGIAFDALGTLRSLRTGRRWGSRSPAASDEKGQHGGCKKSADTHTNPRGRKSAPQNPAIIIEGPRFCHVLALNFTEIQSRAKGIEQPR
jgi:hypothetical protein